MHKMKQVLFPLILMMAPLLLTLTSTARQTQQQENRPLPSLAGKTSANLPSHGTDSLTGNETSAVQSVAVVSAMAGHPFPQHFSYQEGTILPNHISRQDMDDSVQSFYRGWKQHYILPACREGEKYVWFEGTKGTNICV